VLGLSNHGGSSASSRAIASTWSRHLLSGLTGTDVRTPSARKAALDFAIPANRGADLILKAGLAQEALGDGDRGLGLVMGGQLVEFGGIGLTDNVLLFMGHRRPLRPLTAPPVQQLTSRAIEGLDDFQGLFVERLR
jgi:hypothetical protein